MIRTFIAVELSPELRNAVHQVQADMKETLTRRLRRRDPAARIQWVRPESMHLTLKFLGSIEESTIPEIEHTMRAVVSARAKFSLDMGGLGVFPDVRAPRVLWVGLSDGVEALVLLAADLDRSLHALGFAPEGRPFQPHLTLARIKDRSLSVGTALAESGVMTGAKTVGRLSVSSISLMRSELKPSGAVYTRLCEVLLPNGSGQAA